MTVEQISVSVLMQAAIEERWDEVDSTIIPYLAEGDPVQITSDLLPYLDDKNSDLRDAAASALRFVLVKLNELDLFNTAVRKLREVAISDPDPIPTIRAGLALITNNDERLLPEDQLATGIDIAGCQKRIHETEGWLEIAQAISAEDDPQLQALLVYERL